MGLWRPWMDIRDDILKHECGVLVERRGHCCVSRDVRDSVQGYNAVVFPALYSRHGTNFWNDAEVRAMGIDAMPMDERLPLPWEKAVLPDVDMDRLLEEHE